jgi:hypothetical protein
MNSGPRFDIDGIDKYTEVDITSTIKQNRSRRHVDEYDDERDHVSSDDDDEEKGVDEQVHNGEEYDDDDDDDDDARDMKEFEYHRFETSDAQSIPALKGMGDVFTTVKPLLFYEVYPKGWMEHATSMASTPLCLPFPYLPIGIQTKKVTFRFSWNQGTLADFIKLFGESSSSASVGFPISSSTLSNLVKSHNNGTSTQEVVPVSIKVVSYETVGIGCEMQLDLTSTDCENKRETVSWFDKHTVMNDVTIEAPVGYVLSRDRTCNNQRLMDSVYELPRQILVNPTFQNWCSVSVSAMKSEFAQCVPLVASKAIRMVPMPEQKRIVFSSPLSWLAVSNYTDLVRQATTASNLSAAIPGHLFNVPFINDPTQNMCIKTPTIGMTKSLDIISTKIDRSNRVMNCGDVRLVLSMTNKQHHACRNTIEQQKTNIMKASALVSFVCELQMEFIPVNIVKNSMYVISRKLLCDSLIKK